MQVIPSPDHDGCRLLPRTTVVDRRAFLAAGVGCACLMSTHESLADENSFIDPSEFGLEIPPGPVSKGGEQRVLTTDTTGQSVVGRLYATVGDHQIVLLPDGSLVARTQRDAPQTERPWAAIDKKLLATQLLVGPLAKHKSRETRRYLYLYNTSEEFAIVTSRILEQMLPGISSYYETRRHTVITPETPLVVLMFRTEEEFQNYRRMPAGIAAYYHILSNQVVMYEESKLFKVKPELGLQQAISTIAHEGAHQILNNIGIQQRLSLWPMWLGEGLAEYFAPTTVGKRLNWKGAGQVNDLRMYELEVYLQSRAGEVPNGALVSHTVSAARLTSTGYASAWALTTFLAKQERPTFNRYVAEVSKLGPFEGKVKTIGRGIVPQNLSKFQEFFGEDTGSLEERLVAYLKRLPYEDPFADWPHFAAFVQAPVAGKPRREAHVFHTADLAQKWERDTLDKLAPESRDKAQSVVREFPSRPLAERATAEFLRGR